MLGPTILAFAGVETVAVPSAAAHRYREVMRFFLGERALAEAIGCRTSEERESRLVADLDSLWWAMTSAEQAEAERWLAAGADGDTSKTREMAQRWHDRRSLDATSAVGGLSREQNDLLFNSWGTLAVLAAVTSVAFYYWYQDQKGW